MSAIPIPQRQILIWRTRPPTHEVKHQGPLDGLNLETIEAYDQATRSVVFHMTGEQLPIKQGPLRQSDILITPSAKKRGAFEVWLVRGQLH